ncbi:chemotaxis-specific protein-glutamate methyltransferase CheB [bacterium]|nr:chemotaxis-specific protein-glutamate methyltransferase CheB [bacterium]
MGIKVLCAEDSKHVRNILVRLLNSSPNVEEVFEAADGEEAAWMAKALNPDVITLDLKMPKMDGLTALRRINTFCLAPVIIISSYTQPGAIVAVKALEEGAFGVISKPASGKACDMISMKEELIAMVEEAYNFNLERMAGEIGIGKLGKLNTGYPFDEGRKLDKRNAGINNGDELSPTEIESIRCIGIGSSTGGPKYLAEMLPLLGGLFPWPIIIIQHIPAYFAPYFVASLNDNSLLNVKIAEDGEIIKRGNIYVAPGGGQLTLRERGYQIQILIDYDAAPLLGAIPSIDFFFKSFASTVGAKAVGILLSGIGWDGVDGLKTIKDMGGITAVQDPRFSMAHGMPMRALEIGAAKAALKISDIPEFIYRSARTLAGAKSV